MGWFPNYTGPGLRAMVKTYRVLIQETQRLEGVREQPKDEVGPLFIYSIPLQGMKLDLGAGD